MDRSTPPMERRQMELQTDRRIEAFMAALTRTPDRTVTIDELTRRIRVFNKSRGLEIDPEEGMGPRVLSVTCTDGTVHVFVNPRDYISATASRQQKERPPKPEDVEQRMMRIPPLARKPKPVPEPIRGDETRIGDFQHFERPMATEGIQDTEETARGRKQFLAELNTYFPSAAQKPPLIKRLFRSVTGQREPAITAEQVITYLPTSEIRQGIRGDCYLLAGLNSAKKTHPELYLDVVSRSIVHDDARGGWRVKFSGLPLPKELTEDGWIFITEDDLERWTKETKTTGELPDLILERAYASAISRQRAGEQDQTMRPGKLAFEGGYGHQALFHVLGNGIARKFEVAKYTENHTQTLRENIRNGFSATKFLATFAEQPQRYLVTAVTPSDAGAETSIMVGIQRLKRQHAYSVVGSDGQQVAIEDPHDTGQRFFLTTEQFLSAFSSVEYCEIVGAYPKT